LNLGAVPPGLIPLAVFAIVGIVGLIVQLRTGDRPGRRGRIAATSLGAAALGVLAYALELVLRGRPSEQSWTFVALASVLLFAVAEVISFRLGSAHPPLPASPPRGGGEEPTRAASSSPLPLGGREAGGDGPASPQGWEEPAHSALASPLPLGGRGVGGDGYALPVGGDGHALPVAGDGSARRAWGEVSLTVLATIFKKIKLNTHENIGWGKIHLPEDNTHTTAYWLALPNFVGDALSPVELQEGLLGLAHVLAHVAPLYLMCDPRDLGVHPEVKAPHTGRPTVFVYDNVPGGIGFAERLYNLHDDLLRAAGDLIAECPCDAGCPSCVGVPTEPKLSGKALTRQLLGTLAVIR
jgi:hypothetical protein